MATVRQQIHEHDVVRLRRQAGSWPPGQEGTVVGIKGPWKLIEIADDRGAMLDLISVADQDLDVLWSRTTNA
jgi:hypothetical protein